MEHHINAAVFWTGIFSLSGLAILDALRRENKKIPLRVWDRSEQVWGVVGLISVLVGVCCFANGCGTSLPEPTDPVSVEVIACEPTLGTSGQYLKLSSWRREVGVCAVMRADLWDRQEILDAAEHDVDRLDREYDTYRAEGRTDCYCGSVCREVTEFLEGARRDGLFCRGP